MTRVGACCLFLVVAGLFACDSEQPLTNEATQTIELHFTVMVDSVRDADIWDAYTDSNGNRQVDPGEPRAGFSCGFQYFRAPELRPAPWRISVDIRVVRDGSLVQERITTVNTAANFLSVTEQDPTVTTGVASDQPPFPEGGFAYNNPRLVPETSYDFLSACNADLPYPAFNQVGGLPTPVRITLFPGDTLIVTAGQETTSLYNYANPGPLEVDIFADGEEVTPDGTTNTTNPPGGALRFSYQYR